MCKHILYQTCIKVGKFGRRVYTKPRKWKWLAKMDAILYCLCEMRETKVFLIGIKKGTYYRHGTFIEVSPGIIQATN